MREKSKDYTSLNHYGYDFSKRLQLNKMLKIVKEISTNYSYNTHKLENLVNKVQSYSLDRLKTYSKIGQIRYKPSKEEIQKEKRFKQYRDDWGWASHSKGKHASDWLLLDRLEEGRTKEAKNVDRKALNKFFINKVDPQKLLNELSTHLTEIQLSQNDPYMRKFDFSKPSGLTQTPESKLKPILKNVNSTKSNTKNIKPSTSTSRLKPSTYLPKIKLKNLDIDRSIDNAFREYQHELSYIQH